MHRTEAGKVCDSLWYLGREESGVYLLEGSESSIIISGGMSYIVPEVMGQIETFGIDKERINKLLILHSHFDHVGIVPYFKRSNPDMELYASSRAWNILAMPKAISTINQFSRSSSEKMGLGSVPEGYDLEWREGMNGLSVAEGDRIDIGGLTISILETPGHSSCSISAYVHEMKALFPSDAGGIPYKDGVIASGNSNYTQFQESLEKLKELDVEYFCADHYGYMTGQKAAAFIEKAIMEASSFRELMERVYRRSRSIEKTVSFLVMANIKANPEYFLTKDVLEGIYGQMIRHIAKAIEEKGQ